MRSPLALLFLIGMFTPNIAAAHAILIAGTPAPGASVPAGHLDVRLRFNSRIDPGRSRLTLIAPDRRQITLPVLPAALPDVLNATAELAPGAYVLRWQVLAVDGHITRGDVAFSVTGR